jgi:hypothetical protein
MSSCCGTAEACPSTKTAFSCGLFSGHLRDTHGADKRSVGTHLEGTELSLCVTVDILSIEYLWLTPMDAQETA